MDNEFLNKLFSEGKENKVVENKAMNNQSDLTGA